MHKILTILSLLLTITVHAQTVLTGTVRDENNDPVEMVMITALNPADSTIVSYASTDEEGKYSLSFTHSKLRKVLLRMAGFNVRTEFRTVENQTQHVDWTCMVESTLLNEVIVKAQKLWGSKDTLNYLVSAYSRVHDVTIGDVLKRLPGIEIKENGGIYYQGVPISKFYVGNMNALQGQYNIATKGIRPEDVASVQVMEQHQHIKALADQTPPESAALNLKLKQEKKEVWSKSANLGLGYSDHLLWNATARAMLFGQEKQHIMVYDTQNDGLGSNMLASHDGGNAIFGNTVTSASSPDSSPFGNNHRNNYHQLAFRNLWRLNDSTEVHADVSYQYDFVRTKTDVHTTYILPDGTARQLLEDFATQNTLNKADVNLMYERNARKDYLQNQLYLSGYWNHADNMTSIREKGNSRTLGVYDQFHWVHRTSRGGGFDFKSRNEFSVTPQRLTVSPGVFPELLSDSIPYAFATQTATVHSIESSNSFSLLNDIRRHRFTFAPALHANVKHVTLESQLNSGKRFGGDMEYTRFDVGAGLSARYTHRHFYANLALPVSLQPTVLGGTSHSISSRTRLYFNPSASFTWRMNDYWASSGSAAWSSSPSSWHQLYTAYMLRSYSSLSRYTGDMYDTSLFNGRIKLDYKHIFGQFFGWVEFGGSLTSADMTYGSRINEQGYSEMQMVRQPHSSRNIQVCANLRKDFSWKQLSMEVTGSYAHGTSQYLRQDVLTRYESRSYNVEGKLGIKPFNWLDFKYVSRWSRYGSQTDSGISSRSAVNWGNTLSVNSTIIDKHLWLSLNATHEYNNLLDKRNNKYLSAQLRYLVNRMEFTLRAENLLNMRQYSTLSISDMTERYTVYHLQPLTVMLVTSIHF